MSSFRFTLSTVYGPATFVVEPDPDGFPRVPQAPLATLPDAALKLSYGSDWTAVRQHFLDLTRFLPFSLDVYRSLDQVPAEYQAIIARLEPTDHPSAGARFWSKHAQLAGIFHPDEGIRRSALARIAAKRNGAAAREAADVLFEYLVLLSTAESLQVVPEAYRALGAIQSPEARTYLLGQLAQEGRHPYTRHLLRALSAYTEGEVLQQAHRQYDAGHIGGDDLPALLDLIASHTGEEATRFAVQILEEHAYLVERVSRTLRQTGLGRASIASIITEQFWRETEYAYLDDLLVVANAVRPATLDLSAINERAAHHAFVDVPPVNWPQQLESGWSDLVRSTPLPEVLSIVADYLIRSAPRLQRNALLQLKLLVARPDFGGSLPAIVEHRLAELLGSRFEKVYVEVLNLLARRELQLSEPLAMVREILHKSLQTSYRTVILKALRNSGDSPEARRLCHAFYLETIRRTDHPAGLERVAALLPYIEKYLGDVSELRAAMQAREVGH